jgi:hypothetical protein
MKSLFIIITSVAFMQLITAQPTLKKETHALLPGSENPMTLCKYIEPGFKGNNATWDFSKLEPIEKFTGTINEVYENEFFSSANVDLEEFGSHYYFFSDENKIKQVGYSSKDNKTIVKYSQPYEKMVFPLSLGELHNCTFAGNYMFDGKELGIIKGNGLIEADAWGTIILPNNSIYQNTLRVKSIKSYSLAFGVESSQEVEIITYRWYNNFHRYPLLVLTEYTTKSGSNTSINYQAAYNNNAVSLLESPVEENSLVVYPNPAYSDLYLNYSSNSKQTATISIFDISGKIVFELKPLDILPGENYIPLSTEEMKCKPGTYLLNFTIDEKTISEEIIITE